MESSDPSAEEFVKKISDRIWTTKGSRWNAVRRLKNQSQLSVFSISLLSIFGIAVPIIQVLIDTNKCLNIDNLYTLVSILLSIFILVLSILEGAKNHQVKAVKLESNAIEISSLSKEMNLLVNYKVKHIDSNNRNQIIEKAQELYIRYDTLIKLCPENHETEDYLLFQAQNYKHFNKRWLWSIWILTWLRIKYYWLYISLMLIIATIVFKLYFSCPI